MGDFEQTGVLTMWGGRSIELRVDIPETEESLLLGEMQAVRWAPLNSRGLYGAAVFYSVNEQNIDDSLIPYIVMDGKDDKYGIIENVVFQDELEIDKLVNFTASKIR